MQLLYLPVFKTDMADCIGCMDAESSPLFFTSHGRELQAPDADKGSLTPGKQGSESLLEIVTVRQISQVFVQIKHCYFPP